MKKFLPLIFFAVGLVVLGGVYFFVIRDKGGDEVVDEDETVAEIPIQQRPVVTLAPTEDGHYLLMEITHLDRLDIGAETLDYELLYQTDTGFTQGVPGTVELAGDTLEKEFLLGSESSGKFRYDEGVETGTLTLRFRNDNGKLVGKLSGQWHFQSEAQELTSVDGNFTYTVDEPDGYSVVMETFGVPGGVPGTIAAGPYGVYSSSEDEVAGEVSMDGTVYYWDAGEWAQISETSDNVGIFVSI